MVSQEQIRRLALALPQVVEQDHHGRPSFRVAGRIFATLWDEGHMNVMLDEPGIRTALQSKPSACEEFWWGKRLRAVHVDLALADEALARELLTDAWERKAPRRLTADRLIVSHRQCREASLIARHLKLQRDFSLGDDDLDAWHDCGLPDDTFDDWLTDRVARRPTGRRARATYGAEDVHEFARRAILDALQLGVGDRMLEVGCGGGLLLREALATGVGATGLDHSAEMVSLARERAPGAVVVLGSAERLPFADGSFTAVAMSIVFMFLPDPIAALRECHRVLITGGRVAIYTTSPQLRGTPAAPEPLATRSCFYEDEELAALARQAELKGVLVANEDGGQLITATT
jgi:SAM-dependent methyltransferase